MARATTEVWSYSAGEVGRNRVRAYERGRGDVLLQYVECEEDGTRRRHRVSLGHCSRDDAKVKADELAANFATADAPPATPKTLKALFETYENEVTPTKGRGSQVHDRLCIELFLKCFGTRKKTSALSQRNVDKFARERRSGALRPKRRKDPKPVGDRQVQHDLKFLIAVLNWATRAKDDDGRPLLDRHPLLGVPLPAEKSPQRPRITDSEYRRMAAVAAQVHPQFALALIIVHETGHRLASVRHLKWSDIDLSSRAVRWRAENDKIGFEHTTILTDAAVQALEAARNVQALEAARSRLLAIGDVWVFPASRLTAKPRHARKFVYWWQEAERLAELPIVTRRGWHSLRRKFATEMKHAPLKDLCHLGGWKTAKTVIDIYQAPDEATMTQALATRRAVG